MRRFPSLAGSSGAGSSAGVVSVADPAVQAGRPIARMLARMAKISRVKSLRFSLISHLL
jgi:hypothetical protein